MTLSRSPNTSTSDPWGRAETTSTAGQIRSKSGNMVLGPRLQFSPTTAAPASAKRLQASSGLRPSRVSVARWKVSVMTAGSPLRSEEHTSELQSLMRISYAVFCLKKKKNKEHQQRQIKKKT